MTSSHNDSTINIDLSYNYNIIIIIKSDDDTAVQRWAVFLLWAKENTVIVIKSLEGGQQSKFQG